MPCIDWNIAECSLSTGIIHFPYSASHSFIILPAATSVSLLASATRFLLFMAEIVGSMPVIPTTAVTTVSAFCIDDASTRLSFPPNTFIFVSLSFILSSRADATSATQTSSGLNSRACLSSRATFLLPVIAVTLNSSLWSRTMSSVCVPIEPVEPRIDMFISFVYLL